MRILESTDADALPTLGGISLEGFVKCTRPTWSESRQWLRKHAHWRSTSRGTLKRENSYSTYWRRWPILPSRATIHIWSLFTASSDNLLCGLSTFIHAYRACR